MARNWISKLFGESRSRSSMPSGENRRVKPQFVHLEDRSVPAVTTFNTGTGQLTIDLNFDNEAADISNDGTNLTITSSDPITGDGATFTTSKVNSITLTNVGGKASQTFTFTSSTPITLSQGLTATSIATLNFNNFIMTTGSSSIDATATQNIAVSADLSAGDGGVTLKALGKAALDTIGVEITSATVSATGPGHVNIVGFGGGGSAGDNYGVFLNLGAKAMALGSGSVNITGTAGAGDAKYQIGVDILDSQVSTASQGNVTITGIGGVNSTKVDNDGVDVRGNSLITTGGGNVTITGTAGGKGAGAFSWGVWVTDVAVITAGGTGKVLVVGQGGQGSGGENVGVGLIDNAKITSGGGPVTISGTGGVGKNSFGVSLRANSVISSGGGPVSITGVGNSTSLAVELIKSAKIDTSATNADITITADSLNIIDSALVDAGNGKVTILTKTATTKIHLADADDLTSSPLVLGLAQSDLDAITAKGGITLGSPANTGGIIVKNSVTFNTSNLPNVFFVTSGSVTQNGSPNLTAKNLDILADEVILTDAAFTALHTIDKLSSKATGAGKENSIGIATDVTLFNNGVIADGNVNLSVQGTLTVNAKVESVSKNISLLINDYKGTSTVKAATVSTNADDTKGTIFLSVYDTPRDISLGIDDVAGKLSISNAELQNFTAGRLVQIGDNFSVNLEVNDAMTAPTGFSKLILAAKTSITNTVNGSLKVGSLGLFLPEDGGTAKLDNANNDVQIFASESSFKANSVEFKNNSDLTIGTVGLIVGSKIDNVNGVGTGTITINNTGDVTIEENVEAPGQVTITATGQMTLNANKSVISFEQGTYLESQGDLTYQAGSKVEAKLLSENYTAGKLTNNGAIESFTKNVFIYVNDYSGTGTVKALTPSTNDDNSKGSIFLAAYDIGVDISLGLDDVPSKLSISNAELQGFSAGRLVQIGDNYSPDLVVNDAITAPAGVTKFLLSAEKNITDTANGKITVDGLGIYGSVPGLTVVLDSGLHDVNTFAASTIPTGFGSPSGGISVTFINSQDLIIGQVGFQNGLQSLGTDDGSFDVSAVGKLTVTKTVSAKGAVSLHAIDTAAATDKLTINPGVLVTSLEESVTLNAGDEIDFGGNDIKALGPNGKIYIILDNEAVDPDPGVGVTFTVPSHLLYTTNGTFITTGKDKDTVTVTPSATSTIDVQGNDPSTFPGDVIILDANNNDASLSSPGEFSIAGFKLVSFGQFEEIQFINEKNITFNGGNGDDYIEVQKNGGGKLQVTIDTLNNGAPIIVPASLTKLDINGKAGNDTLRAIFENGPMGIPVNYSGDGQTKGDFVQIQGKSDFSNSADYYAGATPDKGKFVVGADVINFENTEFADAFQLDQLSTKLNGNADVWTVQQGTQFGKSGAPAIQISGTTGGVAFVPLSVSNTVTLNLDTTFADVAGDPDTITLKAIDQTVLVKNLNILTGVGADLVEFTGDLDIVGSLKSTTDTNKFSTSKITTGTTQTYTSQNGLLNSNVTLSSTAAGDITFNTPLNKGFELTVNTAGVTNFNGLVGNTTPLAKITTDKHGLTKINTTSMKSTGEQTFNDPVELLQNVTLEASTATFNGKVTGNAKSLTITGNAVFGDAAADTVTGLATLSVSGNTTINTNTVTSTGTQTYSGNLTIGAPAGTAVLTTTDSKILVGGNTTLQANLTTNSGTADTTFTGTIDGTFDLQVNSTGNTTFGGAVGTGTPLQTVTTNAGGTTKINGGTVATTKTQVYNDAVVVGKDTIFSSTGTGPDGLISFGSTLDGGFEVTITTASTTNFADKVGNTMPLAKLTTNGGGVTAINGQLVKTNNEQSYADAVVVGANTTFVSVNNKTIEFLSTLNGTFDVVIKTGGLTKFDGEVGTTNPLQSLTTDQPGTVAVNGGKVFTVGNMTFNEDLASPALITTGGPATTLFKSVLAGDVTQTGTGNLTFMGDIDATNKELVFCTLGDVIIEGKIQAGSVVFDCGATIDLNGQEVNTTGAQLYTGKVVLTEDTKLNASSITFSKTVDSDGTPRMLTITTTSGTTANGDIGTTSSLQSLEVNGPLTFSASNIVTVDSQKYNGPTKLTSANTFLQSTAAGPITFNKTLDGATHLKIQTGGTTTFNDIVGGSIPLNSLFIVGIGNTTINTPLMQTNGEQRYDNPVTLTSSTTFNSINGGHLLVNKTLTGAAQDATFNTAGVTRFNDLVTLKNLTTNAGGATVVNTAKITTSESQTYNDDVELLSNTEFNGGTNITFNGTLIGMADVFVNTPAVSAFNGVVLVKNLTTSAGGATTIGTSNVSALQNLTFNDAVSVLVPTTLFAGQDATFNSTLSAFDVTTINADNDVTLNGAVVALKGLNVNAGGNATFNSTLASSGTVIISAQKTTTHNDEISAANFWITGPGNTVLNSGKVTTTGYQKFDEPMLMMKGTTFQGGGLISFQQLSGNVPVLVVTVDETYFNKTVNVGSLSTIGGGRTQIGSDLIKTSGSQNYDDEVYFYQPTTFEAGGDIVFGNILASACQDLVLLSPGEVIFNAPVNVGTITSDAPGSVVVNTAYITTCNSQVFNDPVNVLKSTSFTSNNGQDLAFNNTVTGNSANTNFNTNGLTYFNAAVNVKSLTTDTKGFTVINAGSITTVEAQDYYDKVILPSNNTLKSGSITTFHQSVSGAGTLTVINSSSTIFNGPVTIQALTTDAGGQTIINTSNITTTQAQVYGDAVQIKVISKLQASDFLFGSSVNASNNLTLNLTGGQAKQAGAGLTVPNLGLTGTGTFNLDSAANNISGNLLVNMTGGTVNLRDADSLTIDPTQGIVNTGDVTLTTGKDFTLAPSGTSGQPPVLVNLNGGTFRVQPGLFSTSDTETTYTVRVTAEMKASKAIFGLPDGQNNQRDVFVIRPSVNTPIVLDGNAPFGGAAKTGDRLSLNLKLNDSERFFITNFAYNGQDGFYEFSNGQRIDFFSIESIAGSSVFGFAVQTSEVGDATPNFDAQGKPIQKPSYAVRAIQNINGQNLASNIIGSGIPENPFVVSPKFVNPVGKSGPPRLAFGDINGDGVTDLVLSNGPGDAPLVTVINGLSAFANSQSSLDLSKLTANDVIAQFYAFEPTFQGGVNIAVGNILNNGRAQIVVGAETGGGPRVRTFNLESVGGTPNLVELTGKFGNFFAYEPSFTGGVRVAVGDVNGDGHADLIVSPGVGGGPRVIVFDGAKAQEDRGPVERFLPSVLSTFFAYSSDFRGGMFVDAGDFNNDGKADILTGTGVGGTPHVRIFSGAKVLANDSTPLVEFFANFNAPQSQDSLFPQPFNGFLGVNSVSFGALSNPAEPRDVLVAAPRGLRSTVLRYKFTQTNPGLYALVDQTDLLGANASENLGLPPGAIAPISPSPSQLVYGSTVGGFLDVGAEDSIQ